MSVVKRLLIGTAVGALVYVLVPKEKKVEPPLISPPPLLPPGGGG